MYKEFYISKLPLYLQDYILEEEPCSITINYEKDYFIKCTKSVIDDDIPYSVLYHVLYLTLVY